MNVSVFSEVVLLSMAVVADAGAFEGDRHPDAVVRMMRHMRIVLYLVMVWSLPDVYHWLIGDIRFCGDVGFWIRQVASGSNC